MESLTISLPPPNSPLRRQIGVSLDGYPLSPISLSRSISAVSSHAPECCEEKTRKQLQRYLFFLRNELYGMQDELTGIRNAIQEATTETSQGIIELKANKEKEVALLHKKIVKTENLIKMIRNDD